MIFFKTIVDIGFQRLFKRIKYELRKIFDKNISPDILLKIYGFKPDDVNWYMPYSFLKEDISLKSNISITDGEIINFNFIGISRKLIWPIEWNNERWERLWQFNIHYFDWIKKDIDIFLRTKKLSDNLSKIEFIIDYWIKRNIPGRGDGWHSYTLSLRIRNWILLFVLFPRTIKESRMLSLWQQICWLYHHPESCHGGNHWLENLISLSVACLHFKSKKSRDIFSFSIKTLRKELRSQILFDGGHEERSAGYHFLILERLIELGCFLKIFDKTNFEWLDTSIGKMLLWAEKVKIENDQLPRFNDSSIDMIHSPDEIINFGYSYLNNKVYKGIKLNPLKNILIKKCLINSKKKYKFINFASFNNKKSITEIFDTGWTILRPGGGWEILFKWGESCPKHLPAHAQSDLLSFDIFYKGIPIIVEAGTSTYEYGPLRLFQRSASAHNIFQLGHKKNCKWIEPVEVWGNFRAGFKASPLDYFAEVLEDKTLTVNGSHDGFLRFGANYSRQLFCFLTKDGHLKFTLVDKISNIKKMFWRQFWHFSPIFNLYECKSFIKQINNKDIFNYNFYETDFANGFGKLAKRYTIKLYGIIEPGDHSFKHEILLKALD